MRDEVLVLSGTEDALLGGLAAPRYLAEQCVTD